MKLFKPVLYWNDDGVNRDVALKIVGTEDFLLHFTLDADRQIDMQVVPEPPAEDSDDEVPPQQEFLAAVFTVLKPAIGAWLATPDPNKRKIALAGMGVVFEELCRTIDFTPRNAEFTLELMIRSDMSGVPAMLGAMLFQDDILKAQVEQPSELEVQLREKFKDHPPADLAKVQAALRAEIPPLAEQRVFPPIPDDAKAALAAEQQRRVLMTTPPAGSA